MTDDLDHPPAGSDANPFDQLSVLLWCQQQGTMHITTLAEQMILAADQLEGFCEPDSDPWTLMAVGPAGFIDDLRDKWMPMVAARYVADVALGKVSSN